MSQFTKKEIEELEKLDLGKFATIPFVHADEMLKYLRMCVPKTLQLIDRYAKLEIELRQAKLEAQSVKSAVSGDVLCLEINRLIELEQQTLQLKNDYIKKYNEWQQLHPPEEEPVEEVPVEVPVVVEGFWKKFWQRVKR